MKKPVIGLIPLVDEARDSLWMLPGYMDGVRAAGGLPLMLPLTDDPDALMQLFDFCDGLLLTGGHDVAPEVYHEAQLPVCGECSPERDRMELIMLREAIRRDVPVLGICRGVQFINAALGGTLYQDLPTQHPSDVCHHQQPPYSQPSHTVELVSGTPLQTLLRLDTLSVNSCHHQAIKALSPELQSMAVAPDGLIEAAYRPASRFVWGVQWHPEFAWNENEDFQQIFRAFVSAC